MNPILKNTIVYGSYVLGGLAIATTSFFVGRRVGIKQLATGQLTVSPDGKVVPAQRKVDTQAQA